MYTLGESHYPRMPEINVTIRRVTKLLQNLIPRKAAGLDNIPYRRLRTLAQNHSLQQIDRDL